MEGQIELCGMHFWAYHGCLESERREGNEFVVDFRCPSDFGAAAASDNLEDTLDYSRVYEVVAAQMKEPSNLLEHLCCRIAESLQKEFPSLEHFELTVSKKNPPVGGECEWAKVSIKL
jgi:dihydroneopterin aldolase